MQVVQTTRRERLESDKSLGLTMLLMERLTSMFRCWHRKMSRPFSLDGETFCVCLARGARRQFNLETWEMLGRYYYVSPLPPLSQHKMDMHR